MNNTNTGGPAFPDGSTNEWGNAYNSGMTLRDYFAAKAMQGVLAGKPHTGNMMTIAKECYMMAEAMLRAREAT
jgi:hypothetical protein